MKTINNLTLNSKIGIVVLIFAIIYSLYYLFKNYGTIDTQLKVIMCLLIFGFIYGIYNTIISNDSFNKLIDNYSLTTGKIMQYFVPNLKGGVASRGISSSTNYIKYTYNVDSKKYENAYDFNNYVDIPDLKPNLDIEYLVIYEKGNPKNSFILLNYPINSSKDFEKYDDLFKDKIPENVFKHN